MRECSVQVAALADTGGRHADSKPVLTPGGGGAGPVRSSRQLLWNELKAGRIKVGSSNRTFALISLPWLHLAALEQALAILVASHPILGSSLTDRTGAPWIIPDPAASPDLHMVDGLDHRRAEQLAAALVWRPFDLARGPLHRAIAIRVADGERLSAKIQYAEGHMEGVPAAFEAVLAQITADPRAPIGEIGQRAWMQAAHSDRDIGASAGGDQ